jgi:dipeptidyl-peptidase 4
MAQTAAPVTAAPLSVEGIFGSKAVRTEYVRSSRWGKDGESYLALEDAPKGGQDIVRYAIADGQRQVVVAAADLVPPGASAPLGIDNYEWSPDNRWLLIQTNGKRFRRTNALSDYWLYDTTTKRLHKIGGDAAPSTLLYATISPDNSRVAYVRGNNIYAEPIAGGPATALTKDGDDYVVNGLADWV